MKRNIHSTHIEDLCLAGKKETLQALSGLVYLKHKLGTLTDSPIVTVKYDGYAIIAGWIGERFFVSSKSVFNKNPKINFTDEDVDRNHSGGLTNCLHLALKYLKFVIPKGKIYQGDYLFDKELLKDSETTLSFQPNTIQYSIEKDSYIGSQIQNKNLGIIFHTEYQIDGTDVDSIRVKSFNVNTKRFKSIPNVWLTNASLNLINVESLTKEENEYFDMLINSIRKHLNVDWTTDTTVIKNLTTFLNSYIRENRFQRPENKATEFETWIAEKAKSEIAKKKTEKGKASEQLKWLASISYANNIKSLTNLFTIHNNLTNLKLLLIKKLNNTKIFNTNLVKNDNSIIPTENEGYVFTKTKITGCKLVDRYSFSLANFSQTYKKGWAHD